MRAGYLSPSQSYYLLFAPPQVGQEWTYVKKDVFNGKTLGLINERVSMVGSTITVDRTSGYGDHRYPMVSIAQLCDTTTAMAAGVIRLLPQIM